MYEYICIRDYVCVQVVTCACVGGCTLYVLCACVYKCEMCLHTFCPMPSGLGGAACRTMPINKCIHFLVFHQDAALAGGDTGDRRLVLLGAGW